MTFILISNWPKKILTRYSNLMKEKLKNPFFQQYALELLLPLVGYFFFDWSLTIIAVFYFLDQIASDIVYARKINKIGSEQKVKNHFFKSTVVLVNFLIIFVAEAALFDHFWPNLISQSKTEFYAEIWDFTVSELWILFPLLIAVYHFKDLFTFYMPRRFANHDFNKTIFSRTIFNLGIFMLVFNGLQLSPNIAGSELPALLVFIGIKLLYDFTAGKWYLKYSLIKQN